MKITFYRDLLAQRINHLDFLPEADRVAAIVQLPALETVVQTLEVDETSSGAIKAHKRPKGEAGLSLLVNAGVPSIKLGKLGSGNSVHRVYLRADMLPDTPGNTDPHYFVTKVYPIKLYPETSEANKAKNCATMENIQYEIEMLALTEQYIRHGVREIGTETDPRTGETVQLLKIYIDSKFISGKTVAACLKEDFREGGKLGKSLRTDALHVFLLTLLGRVSQIHQRGYSHGDLHPGNIIITGDIFGEYSLTIIDFDRARPFGKTVSIVPVAIPTAEKPCPLRQFPPECCGKSEVAFSTACDIYALGYVFMKFEKISMITQFFRDFLIAMYTDMRHQNPIKRPTLQHLENEFHAFSLRALHIYRPYAIPDEIKQRAIEGLQRYQLQGSELLRATVWDPLYRQKSVHIADLVVKLRGIVSHQVFEATLMEGYFSYVRKFIALNLKDYREVLGRGTDCFAEAILACEETIDKTALLDGVKLSLPLNDPLSLNFFHRFIYKTSTYLVDRTESLVPPPRAGGPAVRY